MPDTFAKLRDGLWAIKNNNGGHTFDQMADVAGLPTTTLWRVMRGQRQPNGDTLRKIMTAWPELMGVFLSPDVPDGNPEMPECASEPAA